MKTVVIPDIHNFTGLADFALKNEPADEYVFLGDIFDNYKDNPQAAEKTAVWLKAILERSDCFVLFGNHDVPYRWPNNRYISCPGFTLEKCRVINSVISPRLWEKFRWFYKTQGWFMSHAGLHEKIFLYPGHGFSEPYLNEVITDGEQRLHEGHEAEHCRSGFRTGVMRVGGLTWADWGEFEPIPGVNQIVGHTHYGRVRMKYARKHHLGHKTVCKELKLEELYTEGMPKAENLLSVNFCVDTPGAYAVIEDGQVTFKKNDLEASRFNAHNSLRSPGW